MKWHEIAGKLVRSYCILTLLALLFPAESLAQNLFTAASGSPFAGGNYPISVAVADFNGDGYADLAIADFSGNTVIVLLGNGSGGFTQASGSPFAAGTNPAAVAVGDFNNDGHPDLAISTQTFPGNVRVLLGDGTGGFSAASGSPITVGNFAVSVAVGDFNGDGFQDLAVANQQSNNLTVLLGNGSGGFTQVTGSPFAGGNQPLSITVADFNGDNHPDLAIADGGSTVTVLLGNGSGGFTAATGSPFSAGNDTYSVKAADLNGDGYVDLATANFGSNNVTVLLGNGSGGFTAAGSPFSAGRNPTSVAVGDFNRDGHPDLAIANSIDNNVTVLLNSAPTLTATPPSLTFYASAGQAASENIPVSVASTQTGSTYTVSGSQTWLQPSPLSNPTGSTANVTLSAASASLNAGTYSGIVRFIAPNFFDATTAVTLNVTNPSGTFTSDSGNPFAQGTVPYFVAVADLNGDSHQDLAIANLANNNLTVLLGDGLGGFTAASGSPFAVGSEPSSVAAADFNGDGHLDLAVSNGFDGTLSVLLGNGSGGFTTVPGGPFALGGGIPYTVVADFNGDGHLDVATANFFNSNVSVLLGNGFGEFFPASGSPFAVGVAPNAVAVGDFNRDGHPDLATANYISNDVTVLLGNGSGGFTAATGSPFAAGTIPFFITAADFNGDGHPDLAIVNQGSNNVTVLLGNGSGGFTAAPGSPFAVGSGPSSTAVGDLNGDGYPDLAVTNGNDGNVTLLLGNGSGGFTAASGSFAAGTFPQSIAIGDFNGDGRPDFVTANNSNNVTVFLGASASTSSTLSTTVGATVTYGTSVPLTLTVSDSATAFGSPSGTATFYDGSTSLGSATQRGSPYTFSTSTLSGGSHTLKAVYSGDSTSLTSTSNTVSLTVTQASQTITFNPLSNQTFGVIPFTVTATATSSLPVTFTSTTLSVCTASGSLVTIVGAGPCSITASQAGNTNYSAATSVTQGFTVSQASQTITFNPLSNVTMGTAPFTVSASASSELPVFFISTTPTVCTVSAATVTIVAVGTCSITASQPGSLNYSAAPSVTRTLTVIAEAQTITCPTDCDRKRNRFQSRNRAISIEAPQHSVT